MWVQSSSAAIVLAALAVVAVGAQEPLQIIRERTFSLDMRIDPQTVAAPASQGAAGLAWRVAVRSRFPQGGGLNGIRVEVHFAQPPAAGHTLRVTDGSGREVEVVTDPPQHFWTREVVDGVATIELSRTESGQSPAATLGYAYHVTPIEQQAISGPNQLIPISAAPLRIRRLGRSVARLRFMIAGEGQATCTGFLVGARLLLTNEHCIANDAERASALVDFDFDEDGSPVEGIRVRDIVTSSPGLDYTLLRLDADPPAGAGRLYFAPSVWQWTAPPAPHPLVIVEHPSGRPKEVSIADCRLDGVNRIGVTRGDPSDFGHLCDTLGGSSGSPVMDWTSGLVVGLHHFGFVAGAADPVNQAVSHSRILADVAVKDRAAQTEMARPRPEP